jgi:hypothetical protein
MVQGLKVKGEARPLAISTKQTGNCMVEGSVCVCVCVCVMYNRDGLAGGVGRRRRSWRSPSRNPAGSGVGPAGRAGLGVRVDVRSREKKVIWGPWAML